MLRKQKSRSRSRDPNPVSRAIKLIRGNRFRNAGPRGRHGIAKHDETKKAGR